MTHRFVILSFVLMGLYATVATAGGVAPALGAVVAQQSIVPVDPVIEEPLRPLFPSPMDPAAGDPTRCGTMGVVVLPTLILVLSGWHISPHRARHRRSPHHRDRATQSESDEAGPSVRRRFDHR